MKQLLILVTLVTFFTACSSSEKKTANQNQPEPVKLYSAAVKDTFSVFVSLPNDYDATKASSYPVIYLLDANLYFDIMAVTLKKYSEVGLLSPAILVGVGYKNFQAMDSLRNRDYTFPVAIPEYGMSSSGKAGEFLSFFKNEVIPYMDKNYKTSKNRVLMGHSLGGYFTLYALHHSFVSKEALFSGYISASPSLDYNHNYLMFEFEKLSPEQHPDTKVYITFGGLEDAEEAQEDGRDSTQLSTEEQLAWVTASIKTQNNVHCRGDQYSNLGHMDTPLPSFIRGLQWTLNMTE